MNDKLSTIPPEFLMQILGSQLSHPTPTGIIPLVFTNLKVEYQHKIEQMRAEISEFKLRTVNATIGGMISWATTNDKLSLEKNNIESQKKMNDLCVEIKQEERDKLRMENQIIYFQSKSEQLDYEMKQRAADESRTPENKDRK